MRSESHLHSAFGAMFCFVWRSEPLLIFVSMFRATTYLHSAFRVTAYHSFRRLDPCFASFGIQSHIFIRCSEPLFVFLFRVQSRGFSSTLRVLISIFRSIHHHFPPFWRSEPLGTPSGLLSHFFSLVLAFRAICHTHSGILSRFFP